MAFLLVYLHGKTGAALSNQMRQTKSLSPDYAIRWWLERGVKPPEIDPVDFILKRITWRYAKGKPAFSGSRVYLGDSVVQLPRLGRGLKALGAAPARLLLTSPPYFGLTHYHYDQWLRLWLLGGAPNAYKTGEKHKGRFENREEYESLLYKVFCETKRFLREDAIIYVRTSKQHFTYETTLRTMQNVFPDKRLMIKKQPFRRPTQTQLFGDKSEKAGEIDIVMYNI